ncbi:MAG: cytochrome c [Flavobacteriales bacterium]|nr:cytochrome c [Flavobacteriales bacterium]
MKIRVPFLALSFLCLFFWSCQNKKDDSSNSNESASDLFESESANNHPGKKIYDNKCAACHRESGQGITNAFPPLAQSDYLNANPEKSIEAIIKGLSGEIKVNGVTYNSVMSPIDATNQEIADVLTYVYSQWGNNKTVITPEMVEKLRQ